MRKKSLLNILPVCFTLLCPQIFCHCIYSLRKVQSDDLLGDVEVHFITLEEKTVFYKVGRVCRTHLPVANGMVHLEALSPSQVLEIKVWVCRKPKAAEAEHDKNGLVELTVIHGKHDNEKMVLIFYFSSFILLDQPSLSPKNRPLNGEAIT